MRTIIEHDYLGGVLTITVAPEQRLTVADLTVCHYPQGVLEFHTEAICHKDDKFSEAKGIKLVKMKLTKEFHQRIVDEDRKIIDLFERGLSRTKTEYEFHKNKVDAINKCLVEEFGRQPRYERPAKKPVTKKPTTKKTTKKSVK